MRLPVMHVDHADHIASAYQRNREKSFVGIFDQCGETLEPRIGRGLGRQRYDRLMLGDPPCYAFAHLHAQISKRGCVRYLGGAQNYFIAVWFQQVDKACIALRHLRGESDNLAQHFIERQLGADNAADPMQERYMGTWWFHNAYRGHTSGYA